MRDGLDALEQRTKSFAVRVLRFSGKLENVAGLRQLSFQLARSAGSVAANHRAMRRARSTREFSAKLQIVNEEIDESALWLEVSSELCADVRSEVGPLLAEALELRAIFAKARATTRSRYS
jgi:four helix bundle protein